MVKITEIVSKEVLSLADAAVIGIITNAYVSEDLGRLKGWTVVQDDGDDEGSLPLPRIIGNESAVTVMNGAAVKTPSGIKCPLGMRVFDSKGRSLGVLRDIAADERGKTQTLYVDDSVYDPASVLRASRSGVILRAPEHETILVRRAPTKRIPRKPRPVPLPVENDVLPTEEIPAEKEKPTSYGEYAFLLGRTVSKDLVAHGELLAKEGAPVDATILEAARAKGKLVELTVNSRKI